MSNETPQPEGKPEDAEKAPTLLQTVNSVSASFFGVQSSKNRERDFKHGKASHFIVIGVVMTVIFILVVVLAVKLALRSSGM